MASENGVYQQRRRPTVWYPRTVRFRNHTLNPSDSAQETSRLRIYRHQPPRTTSGYRGFFRSLQQRLFTRGPPPPQQSQAYRRRIIPRAP